MPIFLHTFTNTAYDDCMCVYVYYQCESGESYLVFVSISPITSEIENLFSHLLAFHISLLLYKNIREVLRTVPGT